MPKATYLFQKAALPARYISQNRVSTDAINALTEWTNTAEGRDFQVVTDEDDLLRAELNWEDADYNAGSNLDRQCEKHGVARKFEEES